LGWLPALKARNLPAPSRLRIASAMIERAWGSAEFRLPAAAILGQVGQQCVHGVEARGVDHRAAVAADRDERGLPQPVEMKRQRVGRQAEPRRHFPGRQALGSRLYQQPVGVEPVVLGERGQGRDGIDLFHISTIIE
jgi:hypothetical protein